MIVPTKFQIVRFEILRHMLNLLNSITIILLSKSVPSQYILFRYTVLI